MSGMLSVAMAGGIPAVSKALLAQPKTVVYDRVAVDGATHITVSNLTAQKGFVLTCGDEIVGYSTEGSFSLQDAPPAMLDMLEAMAAAPASVQADGKTWTPVAPLQSASGTIMWNQDSPFNDQCPMFDMNVRCPSGCVATAMAQVMYYHRWPEVGTGQHTYYPVVMSGNPLSADFGNTHYNWNAMLPNYFMGLSAEGYTEAQSRAAVAQLMLHCGVAVDMVYYSSSGATDTDVPPALVNYFKYDPSMAYRMREHYATNDWLDIINRELLDGRMILAYGRAQSGGHAYVYDGMDANGYIHVNWGWGGMSNGYFATSALTPASQGIGGSDGGFNYSQRIITGIKPLGAAAGELHVELTSTEGLTAGKAKIAQGGEVTMKLSGKVTNRGWQDSQFDYALILLKHNGDTACIVEGPKAVTLAVGATGYAPSFGTITLGTLPEGDYVLYPACRTSGGSGAWQRIRDSYIGYPNYLNVTSTASNIAFAAPDYFDLRATDTEVPATIYASTPTLITTMVTNEGDVEYHGEVKAVLKKGTTTAATTANYIIDLNPGESTSIKFTDAFSVAEGAYTLTLVNDDGQAISSVYNVNVVSAPAPAKVVSTQEVVMTSAKMDQMTAVAHVKVDGTGMFKGLLYAFIYTADGKVQRGCLFPEYVSLEGNTAEVTLNGNFENGELGKTYAVRLATYDSRGFILLDDDLSSSTFTLDDISATTDINVDNAQYDYYDLLGRKVTPEHAKSTRTIKVKR